MIRESGSEKKKARFSDRSRSEVTKRERSGETSASAKLRKDTCERVKRAPVRICVCVCVCVKERVRDRRGEQGEGTREKERDRTPSTPILLPPTFSISSTASSSFSSLPPHVPVPSFSQAESNQYFGKVRGRSIRACRSRHRSSFAQISRESATNDQRPIGEDRRWSGSSRFDGPSLKSTGKYRTSTILNREPTCATRYPRWYRRFARLRSGRAQILPGSKAIGRKRARGRRASSSGMFNETRR